MSPRSAPTALLIAPFTISAAITGSTTPGTATATACALGHEFRDEACDSCLADLRHCTGAPPPLPCHVVILATTTLLRRTATAATAALLRGAACPTTACADTRAVEVALAQ